MVRGAASQYLDSFLNNYDEILTVIVTSNDALPLDYITYGQP